MRRRRRSSSCWSPSLIFVLASILSAVATAYAIAPYVYFQRTDEPVPGVAMGQPQWAQPYPLPPMAKPCSPPQKVYALNVVIQIPAELQNLTYLNNLNLQQNYLTGPVPSFMGKFPMQYLSLAINPLSGTLTKELGNLYQSYNYKSSVLIA
ncbi:hypothetical protein BDA96_09G093100 [Sorghum bicolor]|uniref:Uncharacterized protein n=2 Tax=Sorghum bicolor TaxID=4558 RepID=A0A921QBR7_SORBI|nr:hypothetical protein BDA96_09G093100 [Sorghum bicolor]KXG21621.1 hypothetical protein SORBI_3009G088300 [Sorghum bicolor]